MRGWRLLAAVVLGAISLAGCGSSQANGHTEASPSLARISSSGELRACSTGDYRPLTYRAPDGTWSGIDIDMARDLAAHLGARLTVVPTTWSTLLGDLVAGRCDIAVGGVSVTADRAAHASFTIPYLNDGKTPITRCADVARYGTLDQIDRPGVRVVVNPGGTNEQFDRQRLHNATIVPYSDNNTIFDLVADGRADLMITDAIETRWQAAQRPGVLCAVHADAPFDHSQKAYLVPSGDPEFLGRVNDWLRGALADGTWARLAKPWIG